MARIAGVDIPDNKRGEISLTYIFGIGRRSAQSILTEANVNFDKKVKEWNDEDHTENEENHHREKRAENQDHAAPPDQIDERIDVNLEGRDLARFVCTCEQDIDVFFQGAVCACNRHGLAGEVIDAGCDLGNEGVVLQQR